MSDPKPKRPAPFCIRLSEDERLRLERDAGGMPLGAYIKSVLFDSARGGTRRVDQRLLSQLVALSGKSRVAQNIQELADAAHSGSLILTPETSARLDEGLSTIAAFRRMLMDALGLRGDR